LEVIADMNAMMKNMSAMAMSKYPPRLSRMNTYLMVCVPGSPAATEGNCFQCLKSYNAPRTLLDSFLGRSRTFWYVC